VSSNSAAQGTQTECNVLKTVTINNVKIIKYFDSYLSVGFTQVGHGNSPRRVCVLCNEVLEITSVALSKLQHHFKTSHHKHKHKPLSFFQRMLNSLSSAKAFMHTKFMSEIENAFVASVKISYHIAHEGEAHRIGERLVKHCATDFSACMIDEEAARKIQLVPLSDITRNSRLCC
jgi:hypothetical protein